MRPSLPADWPSGSGKRKLSPETSSTHEQQYVADRLSGSGKRKLPPETSSPHEQKDVKSMELAMHNN